MIHIGDTAEGERVEIPMFHFGCFGQSGVGKTKLLKYMISQVVKEGYKVLIFDSKVVGPEFLAIGCEIPLYLQESTDPDVFRSLLEESRTTGKGNLEWYRGGFIEVCEGTQNFDEVEAKLKAKLVDSKIRGRTRQMYYEINHDHQQLKKMLGQHKFSKSLTIPKPIARMPTWKLPNLALQGLVVRSTIEESMRSEEKMIYLIDEAPNFCHQRRYSPAKQTIQTLDAQGRTSELFGWYSGQTLTGFDKANMKNLWYWAVGREMEVNEAKDAWSVQTQKILMVDDIRTLQVREFLVVTPEFTKKVKVPYVDEAQLFPTQSYDGEILERIRVMADDIERRIQAISK